MALVAALLVILLATPAAIAVQHTVGGSGGWTTSVDYDTWAAGVNFTVGDTLLFNYGSSHGVDEVTKDGYDNCDTSNALKSHTGGKTTINLDTAGSMYYICPTFGHCSQGMKLSITVAASSGGGTPTTPSTPATPSTPGNPSPPGNLSPPSGTTSPNKPPPPTTTPSSPNGATGNFGGMNWLVLVLAAGLGIMG